MKLRFCVPGWIEKKYRQQTGRRSQKPEQQESDRIGRGATNFRKIDAVF